jgi:DNA polymerase III epsilon subunit family exonuclease
MSANALSLVETTFVVLDLETSGAAPSIGAGITEIGALKVRGGKIIGEFQTFVNPGHTLPDFITSLTGITDSMLSDAPSIQEILPTFLEFIGSHHETVLVAHNAPFDIGFLKAASIDSKIPWPDFIIVDTVRIARSALGRDEVQDCKLATLAEYFGASIEPNHRALDDARATVDVLHGIFERLGTFGVSTLGELTTFKRKRERKALD